MEDEYKIFLAGVKKITTTPKTKMTQKELGKRIHRDQSTISGWFNGRTSPGHAEVEDMSRAINVPYEKIVEVGRTVIPDIKDEVVKILKEDLNISILSDHREHHNVIEQFKDKPFATKINVALVELEGLDRDSLEEIYEIIQGRIRRLKKRISDSDKTGTEGN